MEPYAIVETGGMQFRMEPGKQVVIPRLDKKEGSRFRFDRVFLIADEKGIEIGQPLVANVTVSARVVEHGKGRKILVYKRKRRKGYERKAGHRQDFTKVLVESLDRKKPAKKKAAAKSGETTEEPDGGETPKG